MVSDSHKQHTLIDISTELKQIIGRIRDTKFYDKVYHIFTTTRYTDTISYEQYKKLVEDNMKKELKSVIDLNNLDSHTLSNLIKSVKKTPNKIFGEYIVPTDDGKMLLDENLIMYDLYNYKLSKSTYKVRTIIEKECEEQGFKVTLFNPEEDVENLTGVKQKIKHVPIINAQNNFKETVLKCEEGDSDFILWAYKQYDFLADAVLYLGYNKIKELDYNITNIKRHTDKAKFTNKEDIIKQELKRHYKINQGTWISMKELKDIFTNVYKTLDYNISPKATDILKYWDCKKASRRGINVVISGYILMKQLNNN